MNRSHRLALVRVPDVATQYLVDGETMPLLTRCASRNAFIIQRGGDAVKAHASVPKFPNAPHDGLFPRLRAVGLAALTAARFGLDTLTGGMELQNDIRFLALRNCAKELPRYDPIGFLVHCVWFVN